MKTLRLCEVSGEITPGDLVFALAVLLPAVGFVGSFAVVHSLWMKILR
jgi:hypothetical protein